VNSSKKKIPGAEGLFTMEAGEPRLIAGRCKSCGTYFFPSFYPVHRPDCKERQMEEVLLSRRGRLESYTIQHYPPPPPFVPPDPFVPYGIGLVTLPEGVNVVGVLTGVAVEELKTNLDVELVVDKFYEDKDGNEVLTWMFRPI